jgi:subtilisin family serine protease
VAGTIAAQDNDRGVVGVAPQASLHIVRVFDSTAQFTASSLVVAMNACGEAGANIVSMSLGGPTVSGVNNPLQPSAPSF